MPTYSFRDSNTGEVFEKVLKISERGQFLLDNPHIEQIHLNAPQINGNVISGNTHRKAFKEVLNKIHSRTAGSVMNKTTEL